ncbi:uncharacterized protein LOC143881363 isoform X2 [Tasmannia lanceolata]
MKIDQTTVCTGCESKEPLLLHNVRHKGIFHSLCTLCVLKFHPASFCPNCFEVYEFPPLIDFINCSKCPSISHSTCVSPEIAPHYICPICTDPCYSDSSCKKFKLDLKSAKVLLAAARIAGVSMRRAAVVARLEAERKVREATLAKKRAREVLERVPLITTKEKKNGKETKGNTLAVERKKKSKGNRPLAAALVAQEQILGRFRAEVGADKLVPVGSDDVGLQEKDKWVQRVAKNSVALAESDNLKPPPISVFGSQTLQNHVREGEKEKLRNSSLMEVKPVVEFEKEKNQTILDSSVVGHQLNSQKSLVTDEKTKLKGFADSDMGPQHHISNQDAYLSKTNSTVILTGSPNTASLLL